MSYLKNKKILFLTTNLDPTNGWGRYSLELTSSLKTCGVETMILSSEDFLPSPLSTKKNYILFPLYAFRIWRLVKSNPPDLIHALVETYAPTTMVLAWLLRRPYFLTIHGSFGVKPMIWWFSRYLQRWSYRLAKTVICVSQYTKRQVGIYEDKANFVVIPNGVGLVDSVGLSQQRNNKIIGIGTVKKRKGFHLVIEALPLVLKMIPDVEYLIIGDLSDAIYVDFLKTKARELGVDGQVKFLGKISDQELINLYRQSGLFVLTPVSDQYNFEGFGLVYLEANIFGLPVVGTYGNGGEEAIKNDYNGLLAIPGDRENLANLITKILSNRELYDKLSANALVWAKDHMWSKIASRYLNLYHSNDH